MEKQPNKPTSQREAILMHLTAFGSITSMEAFVDWSITRLADIVYTLKKEGHNIETEMLERTNRFGHRTQYAKYVLKPQQLELPLAQETKST